MSWKSMPWKSGNRGGNSKDAPPTSVGVLLDIVCNDVPMVGLEKDAVFNENASWMLQRCLESSGKADASFEYCEDRRIEDECTKIGVKKDEVMIVRLRAPGLNHIKAVGSSGKRSVMLALVVAYCLKHPELEMEELWSELRAYRLHLAFQDLLDHGNEELARNRPRRAEIKERREQKDRKDVPEAFKEDADDHHEGFSDDGVSLQLIGRTVPVLELDKGSIFHENVAWLLQTAAGADGKADALYDYVEDEHDLERECRRIGLNESEVGIVRLKNTKAEDPVFAIGTSGKRSIQLACVIALVLNGHADVDEIRQSLKGFNEQLDKPLCALLNRAAELSDRAPDDEGHRGKKRRSEDDDSWKSQGARKRR